MSNTSHTRAGHPCRRLSSETLAVILVTVFLFALCLTVYSGIRQYDEATLRIMTTEYKERQNEVNYNIPIVPSVTERAGFVFRDYPLTMLFLVGAFLALSLWNRRKNANLQSTLCAIFLLLGIGCSTKVMFQGFYGINGEAGFLFIGCFVMVAAFFLWRWMHHQLSPALYCLLVVMILLMIVLMISSWNTQHVFGWVTFWGIYFQPGEMIKAGLILLASCSFHPGYRKIVYVVLATVGCLVVALSGDMGNAVIIAVLVFAMVMLLFDEERISIPLLILFAIAVVIIIAYHSTVNRRYASWGHAMTDSTLLQQKDYISAVIRAGWMGHGMKNAIDFFRATSGGTDGVMGCIQAVFGLPMLLTVMGCYVILVLQCGYSRNVNPSSYPILLQIAVMFTLQVLLNYGGSLDVIPFCGITVPLLSQGGSSTLCTMALMGVMGAALYSKVDGPTEYLMEDDDDEE